MKQKPLTIDGTHGEGGGQILRTAVSLAAILKRPIRIENIRAKRRNPGLAAQHLTSVRAAATVCGAELGGDALGSTTLSFTPGKGVRAGNYNFDVAEAREGGSAVIFLKAVYANCSAGFCAVGERGKPAEDVADEAARQLLAHHSSGAALDLHLGDQILAPLAFAEGPSEFTVESVSRHLQTNKWVIEQFDLARTRIEERPGQTGFIRVEPCAPYSLP